MQGRRRGWGRGALAAALAALVLASLAAVPPAGAAPAPGRPAPVVRGSVQAAYVVGAVPGQHVTLTGPGGRVAHGRADRLGSLVFRSLTPGTGYTVALGAGGPRSTHAVRVLAINQPAPTAFYAGQHLHAGLNYLTMRDGVSLAATVRLPPGKSLSDGPFPTVIEYSGYAVAPPGNLLESLLDPAAAGPKALLPDSATAVGSVLAPVLGFATVSLQMRGTGCSGGAFDLFGPDAATDGYDAVEIAAHQPWVAHHKVGLVGISFSGISQFFVAGTRPPGLAAIAPMSTTDDLYSTGYPGGIFNYGFAGSWLTQRVHDAGAAPGGGQPWATAEIRTGDKTCLANQRLHLQAEPVSALTKAAAYRDPSLYQVRSPSYWARRIDVPVFLVGALQDEQTGPQWPALLDDLSGDKDVFVSMLNGTHADSLGPGTITRWLEFLDLFVADRLPSLPAEVRSLSGVLYQQLTGAPSGPLPALRFTNEPSVAAARAGFIAQDPRVRVLFDNGAGSAGPGAMQPVWEADLSSWPPPQAKVTTEYLQGGTLTVQRPAGAATETFRPDPSARPATDLASSANAWAALPPYHWTPVTGSNGLGFVTAPLTRNLTVIGPASVNLWLGSTARDTDLQATVSDVLPSGQEMYVTSGFLRASDRALGPGSTALHPEPTYLAARARPLPAGRLSLVRIPVDPIAFSFRAGTRLRVTLSAPGGDRPEWAFDTRATHGAVTDTVGTGGGRASALVLAVVPGITPPDPTPPCPSLRGQPCRAYVPAANGG